MYENKKKFGPENNGHGICTMKMLLSISYDCLFNRLAKSLKFIRSAFTSANEWILKWLHKCMFFLPPKNVRSIDLICHKGTKSVQPLLHECTTVELGHLGHKKNKLMELEC